MDELIQKVTEKAGINAEQAKNAVNSVIEFLKVKVPGIGDQISAMLSGGGGGGGIIDSVKSKLGL